MIVFQENKSHKFITTALHKDLRVRVWVKKKKTVGNLCKEKKSSNLNSTLSILENTLANDSNTAQWHIEPMHTQPSNIKEVVIFFLQESKSRGFISVILHKDFTVKVLLRINVSVKVKNKTVIRSTPDESITLEPTVTQWLLLLLFA